MGVGDWVMATGEAKRHFAKTGKKVCFVHPRGHVQWSEVFDNNPKISREQRSDVQTVIQGGGLRPYIKTKQFRQWVWRPYKPEPGEFFFTAEEDKFGQQARGAILLEPHVKSVGHDNKRWPWERWIELAAGLKDQLLIQAGGPGTQVLPGVHKFIQTGSFRDVAALLKYCRTAVITEGGLMHAAAAVGVSAAVIWSEFISPEITGYPTHVNLRHAGAPCGARLNCAGCRKSLEAITVEEVLQAVRKVL